MTDALRTAAQAALQALEFDGFLPDDATHRRLQSLAVNALRAALAAQLQPLPANAGQPLPKGPMHTHAAVIGYVNPALHAEPPLAPSPSVQVTIGGAPQPQGEQQPVAHAHVYSNSFNDNDLVMRVRVVFADPYWKNKQANGATVPLYAAPQPQGAQPDKATRVHALVNDGPFPGMSEAFDAHMGAACWTDPAYRQDAATWAAAWKAAQGAQRVAKPLTQELIAQLAEDAGLVTGENMRRDGYMLYRSIGERFNVRSDHLTALVRAVEAEVLKRHGIGEQA